MGLVYYVGIAGKAGSGKDTVGDGLISTLKHYNSFVVKLPLAYDVKEMAREIWGFTQEELYVAKPPAVRSKLQWLGTQLIRSRAPDFWIDRVVDHAKRHMTSTGQYPLFVVVPDIRFNNEAKFFHDRGIVVKLTRETPKPAFELSAEAKQHESEAGVDGLNQNYIDLTIENNFPTATALQTESSRIILGKLLSKVYCDVC